MENIKKAVVIGDGHGHFNTITQAVSWALTEDATPILLGDLSDSFTKSKRDQLRLMHYALQVMDFGGWMVWGNHDMSYLFPDKFNCSGWTASKAQYFKEIYSKIWNHPRFVPYVWLEKMNILITHAGLSPRLVPIGKDPIEFLEESFKDRLLPIADYSPLLRAGEGSGGSLKVGGITWLRKSECRDPLPNDIMQVVGHTPQGECNYSAKRNIWYIDSLEYGQKDILLLKEDEDPQVIPYDHYGTINKDYL